MSGFEKSKFVSLSSDIEEELTCGICLNVLNNPITTPCCRHSYCKHCILQSLQISSNPNTCPNDRKKLLSKDLIPASRIVTNILEKQEVYCDFKSYGCPQTVRLGQLSRHLIQCMFDPNKSSDKCSEALKSMYESVDKLRTKMRRQELDHLKKQLEVCQREVKLMSSRTTPKTVYIQPNSDEFKKEVVKSAKNSIENEETITTNIESTKLKKKIIQKCKEAINAGSDYHQIGRHLVDNLNNQEFDWTSFVYPKESLNHSLSSSNYVYRMEVRFGDLSILLMAHYSHDDDDDYGNGDFLDYSEDVADDDYDDEDEWEDWRANVNDSIH